MSQAATESASYPVDELFSQSININNLFIQSSTSYSAKTLLSKSANQPANQAIKHKIDESAILWASCH